MSNVINHEGNANQSHMVTTYLLEMTKMQETSDLVKC